MRHSLFRRWALLLALVCSANTTLLPLADALLEHGRPGSVIPADHLEGPGGCGAHSEHCSLSGGTAGPASLPATRFHTLSTESHRTVACACPSHRIRQTLLALHRSRAPPAPLA